MLFRNVAFSLAVCATSAHAQELGALPEPAALEQVLAQFDVPGLAMVPLQDCMPGPVIAVGKADIAADIPVTAQTAFEGASLTKPIFAYIVMTLVEDGMIDLDRPLAATFDYPRVADQAAYAQITPRMILMHRTGLPNWVDEATDFHERSAVIPFEHAPGGSFTYSGEAFQLLQAFVEHETGQSLQDLFVDLLGDVMPHSTLERPMADGVVPARGYRGVADADNGRGFDNLYDASMAASSLVTTAGRQV